MAAPEKWSLSGDYFENCNCDVVCPCLVSPNAPLTARPSQGVCDVALIFHIDRGSYDKVGLDGLNVAVIGHTPGAMGEGNWTVAAAARIGGAVLVAAGLYQLTPLKDRCLSKCRTPITFIMTSWREGAAGALRMGLVHGFFCLGCCWLLFAILFPLGIMNIAVMAAITLVVFAEKALPLGRPASRATAAALVAYGAVVVSAPQLLPTFTMGRDMAMPAPAAPMEMPAPVPGSAAR